MEFKIATPEDIDEMMSIRLEMLRVVNNMGDEQDFPEELVSCSRRYFLEGDQVTCLAIDNVTTIAYNRDGKSGISTHAINEGMVRGVWLGNTSEPEISDLIQKDGKQWLEVSIKGRARKLTNAGVEFEAEAIRYKPDRELKTEEFKNGDDFFLYFKSPADGYLNVFTLNPPMHLQRALGSLVAHYTIGDATHWMRFDKHTLPTHAAFLLTNASDVAIEPFHDVAEHQVIVRHLL